MALADIEYIREFGKLPEESKLPDDRIQHHLDSACREIRRWIGAYGAEQDEDKRADIIEAEACLTMAYLLPVLNTFYTAGITSLQKEIGESEFLFHSPEDMQSLCKEWESRARKRMLPYMKDHENKRTIFAYAAI